MQSDDMATIGGKAASPLNRADMLDYAADLILELKDIAVKAECNMLSGLLDLAYVEAEACARTAARGARSLRS